MYLSSHILVTFILLQGDIFMPMDSVTVTSLKFEEYDGNAALRLYQLKGQILEGLNRTDPLFTQTSWMVNKHRQTPKGLQGSSWMSAVNLVSSYAQDPARPDIISFKLDPEIGSAAKDVESASLVMQLRSTSTRIWRNIRCQNQIPVNPETPDFSKKENRLLSMGQQLGCGQGKAPKLCANANLNLQNSVPDSMAISQKRMAIGKRDRRLRHSVKLVVFYINNVTGRKRKISTQEVVVKRKTSVLIIVPKKFVVKAAASANHVLSVQGACRRCHGRVKLEGVYHPRMFLNKRRKHMRLNPRRPYLVIKFGQNGKSNDMSDQPATSDKR